ncbi:hypothetical protein [Streptomyces longispororuber]|uniref:hypothetical protein n=1 Tax=Streptomyces longispororuber TaxID=68230 RepID=UPI00210A0471|nr:hypothetical protein [Streptomyces longispororuber]MCQ4214199.1 hypothetical protein [Streptomyces longispororuber]
MTSPMALPAPAERLPRSTGGRRALQLALLLGGLIALGFLCGGRAHADASADSLVPHTAAVRDAASDAVRGVRERVVEPVRERVAEPAAEPVREHLAEPVQEHVTEPVRRQVTDPVRGRVVDPVREQVADRATEPVREHVVDPVNDRVLRPVLHTVGDVVRPVGELTGAVVGGLADAAPRPLPSGPPSWPGLPGLPGLPGVSDPAPQPPTAGVPQQPGTDAVPAGTEKRPARPDTKSPAGRTAHAVVDQGTGYVYGYGPAGHRAAPVARAAGQPGAPAAPPRPDGVPSAGTAAGDGGSPRHGDLHAAAFGGRLPVLLVPGALAPGTASPVADRHRDIPEFPG